MWSTSDLGDIVEGTQGYAYQPDNDGDQTQIDWQAVPSVPSGLAVEVVSDSELLVTWDDVEFEHGYDIEVGPSGGTYAPIDGSPFGEDETSVLDSGLTAGTEYCYVVQAFNSGGGSGFSSEVCAIADAVAPVQEIVAPMDNAVVASPVVLSGTASDAGGVAEVRVEVFDRVSGEWWGGTTAQWQTDRTFVTASLDAPVGSTDVGWAYEFDLGGLDPSVERYWWTVQAVDVAGNKAVYSTSNFTVSIDDVVAPVQEIVAPMDNAVVASPVVLSGTASDAGGVAEVRVEVFDRVSGEWWGGTTAQWQTDRTFVTASLDAPVGSTDVGWAYEFDLGGLDPSVERYWWTVQAVDVAGNKAVYSTSNFTVSIDDVVAPVQEIVAPMDNAVVASPVVLSGTASDAGGVAEVRVEVFDRVSGEWWGGTTAQWQTDRTFVTASLDAPVGSTDVGWAYEFDLGGLDPSVERYWWTVQAVDVAGNKAVYSTSNFTVSIDDVVAPVQEIVAPMDNAVVASPVVLSGTASDAGGVAEVRVEVFDRVSGEWWGGTTAQWQTDRTFVTASLDAPVGSTDVGWAYEFDLGGLDPSVERYWWTVQAVDVAGNKAVYSTSNFTVPAGPGP